MNISIWQQFSSNHSSHFTVVGVFETTEAARHAAAEIQKILAAIRQWYDDHPEELEALYERLELGEDEHQPPTEIELAIGKKYDVTWQEGIEWFNEASITTVLDHVVMLKSLFNTDAGPGPFPQIINRLGGREMVAGGDSGGKPFGKITVTVICDAPDERTTLNIVKARASSDNDPSVWNDGTQVNLNWELESSVRWDLAAVIEELKARRCTKIRYRFEGATFTRTEFFHFPPEES